MRQKEAYKNIIECIANCEDRNDAFKFTFEWLQDINWHSEAKRFLNMVRDTEGKSGYDYRTFNAIFGWGLDDSWENDRGEGLVSEILEIVNPIFEEKEKKIEALRFAYQE